MRQRYFTWLRITSASNKCYIRSGVLPICNVRIQVQKPEYRPFPPETDKSLGACLKRRRLELEWSQQNVADFIGIRKDSYQNYEWNRYIPHVKYMKKVNDFLGYNFWYDGSGSLANKVLLYRIEHVLTMSQLAKQLNVSCHTIERIEGDRKHVSLEMKKKFSNLILV